MRTDPASPDQSRDASAARRFYDSRRADAYRTQDDSVGASHGFAIYREHLQELCRSFPRPIDVLDVGCGTGRYFSCLTNVRSLTGVDVSEHMLRAARAPAGGLPVAVERLRLIRADVHEIDFPAGSFDLVYSIGVLAEYTPLDRALLDRAAGWLRGGGKIYLTTVDRTEYLARRGPAPSGMAGVKRRLMSATVAILPRAAGSMLAIRRGLQDEVFSRWYLESEELREIVATSSLAGRVGIIGFDDGKHWHNIVTSDG